MFKKVHETLNRQAVFNASYAVALLSLPVALSTHKPVALTGQAILGVLLPAGHAKTPTCGHFKNTQLKP